MTFTNKKGLPQGTDQNTQLNFNSKPDKSQHPIQIGERFNRLTVVEYLGFNKNHKRMYRCICDCGNEKISLGYKLSIGETGSCGCYQKEKASAINRTHGMSGHRIYNTWCRMRSRCYRPTDPKFPIYGERGIKVCDEWQEFEPFYEWAMANGYKDDLTIDRIDVNGNYEPLNCRWATIKEQGNNKRDTIHLTAYGETHTLSEWSEIKGIKHQTIYLRLHRGMNPEQALAPIGAYASRKGVVHKYRRTE